jgi:hypothetical protein
VAKTQIERGESIVAAEDMRLERMTVMAASGPVRLEVPGWATIARLDASGAACGASEFGDGARGERVIGTLAVRGGQTLRVAAGHRGAPATGPGTAPAPGGATTVSRDGLRLLVAAGGRPDAELSPAFGDTDRADLSWVGALWDVSATMATAEHGEAVITFYGPRNRSMPVELR